MALKQIADIECRLTIVLSVYCMREADFGGLRMHMLPLPITAAKLNSAYNHDRFEDVFEMLPWFHSKGDVIGEFKVFPFACRRRIPRYEHCSRSNFGAVWHFMNRHFESAANVPAPERMHNNAGVGEHVTNSLFHGGAREHLMDMSADYLVQI